MAVPTKASKHRLVEPIVGWEPHDDRRIVFYGIRQVANIQTTAGLMKRVCLTLKAELLDPAVDVAAHVGWVIQGEWKTLGVNTPELWFWDDRYWMKARVSGKGEWYQRGDHLLYPVTVQEPEGFLACLHEERQKIVEILEKDRQ